MESNVPPPPLPVLPPLAAVAAPPYVAPPMRVLPVTAGYPAGRPGIISTLAVMSIIVASLTVLGSLVTGCESWVVRTASNISRTAARPRVVATGVGAIANQGAPATAPAGSDASPAFATGALGLGPADRAVVAQVLSEKRRMEAQRLRQLDAFLADQGQTAFPTGGNSLTPAGVRASVTDDSQHTDRGDADPGHTDFVTAWGTLKIYNAKASFTDRSGTPAEVSADEIGDQSISDSVSNVAATSTTNALTSSQVTVIVNRVQKSSGNKLTPAQLASLTAVLQDPNQQLVTQKNAWSPIRMVSVDPNNGAMIWLSDGFVTIDAQGQSQVNAMNSGPPLQVSSAACQLVTLDAVLSVALAALLMAAGVCLLRQSPSARRLHMAYALVKIPLALCGTAALVWMHYQLVSSVKAAGTSGPPEAIAGIAGIVGALGLVYPVVLLLALRTRAAREYFDVARA